MDIASLKGRVLLFGGLFNPVHNGHLQLLRDAVAFCQPDGILLMPSGVPPHKSQPHIQPRHRLHMLELALQDIPYAFVSDMELKREGTCYTADTLDALEVEAPRVTEWLYCLGSDAFLKIHTWYHPERVLRRVTPVVMVRPGDSTEALDRQCANITSAYGCSILRLSAVGQEVSSTMVRKQLAEGNTPDSVPEEVLDYIRLYHLYAPCNYEAILAQALKPGRFLHCQGVQDTAISLAKRWGADPVQASLAGLLHDCAKSMDTEELLRRLKDWGYPRLETDRDYPPTLHAPAGSYLARELYSVENKAVLQAIARHTIPASDMTLLDKIVFLSDFIEPYRPSFPGKEEVKEMAYKDLDAAFLLCLKNTLTHCKEKKQPIHPGTRAVYQECMEAIKRRKGEK